MVLKFETEEDNLREMARIDLSTNDGDEVNYLYFLKSHLNNCVAQSCVLCFVDNLYIPSFTNLHYFFLIFTIEYSIVRNDRDYLGLLVCGLCEYTIWLSEIVWLLRKEL